jgi:hypothetical protein
MVHPVLAEIVRAKAPIRPEVFRRWQQAIAREIIPALEQEQPVPVSKRRSAEAQG